MFCRQSTVPWCFKFITISCMGPKHAPKEVFSTNLYALEHVHVHSSNLNYAHKCIENSVNA